MCEDATKFSFIEARYSTQWQKVETESQLMKKEKIDSQMGIKAKGCMIAIVFKTKNP